MYIMTYIFLYSQVTDIMTYIFLMYIMTYIFLYSQVTDIMTYIFLMYIMTYIFLMYIMTYIFFMYIMTYIFLYSQVTDVMTYIFLMYLMTYTFLMYIMTYIFLMYIMMYIFIYVHQRSFLAAFQVGQLTHHTKFEWVIFKMSGSSIYWKNFGNLVQNKCECEWFLSMLFNKIELVNNFIGQ